MYHKVKYVSENKFAVKHDQPKCLLYHEKVFLRPFSSHQKKPLPFSSTNIADRIPSLLYGNAPVFVTSPPCASPRPLSSPSLSPGPMFIVSMSKAHTGN